MAEMGRRPRKRVAQCHQSTCPPPQRLPTLSLRCSHLRPLPQLGRLRVSAVLARRSLVLRWVEEEVEVKSVEVGVVCCVGIVVGGVVGGEVIAVGGEEFRDGVGTVGRVGRADMVGVLWRVLGEEGMAVMVGRVVTVVEVIVAVWPGTLLGVVQVSPAEVVICYWHITTFPSASVGAAVVWRASQASIKPLRQHMAHTRLPCLS